MGMVAIVKRDRAQAIGNTFEAAGHSVAVIGEVIAGEGVSYTGSLA